MADEDLKEYVDKAVALDEKAAHNMVDEDAMVEVAMKKEWKINEDGHKEMEKEEDQFTKDIVDQAEKIM